MKNEAAHARPAPAEREERSVASIGLENNDNNTPPIGPARARLVGRFLDICHFANIKLGDPVLCFCAMWAGATAGNGRYRPRKAVLFLSGFACDQHVSCSHDT